MKKSRRSLLTMKEILFLLLVLTAKATEFNLEYVGDSLSNAEANARDFCVTKYCASDSEILFHAATQNTSVDPCTDFKEFSMGTFIKEQELPESYFSVGLLPETQRLHERRLQKLLEENDQKNDPRVFKVMKNFYEKCNSSCEFRKFQGRIETKLVCVCLFLQQMLLKVAKKKLLST